MNFEKACETMLKNNKHPCFMVDYDTNIILTCNDEMKKLLSGKKQIVGEVFYELLQVDSNATPPELDWGEESVLCQKMFFSTLKAECDVTYSILEKEKKLLFIEYAHLVENQHHKIYQNMVNRISDLSLDNESKLTEYLSLLGTAYQGDCSYVHVLNHSEKTIKLKYSWLHEQVTDTTHYLVKDIEDVAGFEGLLLWAKIRDESGIWDCDVNRTNSPNLMMDKIALGLFKRKNLILCGVENQEGELLTVVSVGDCKSLRVNHDFLKYVTSLVHGILSEKE